MSRALPFTFLLLAVFALLLSVLADTRPELIEAMVPIHAVRAEAFPLRVSLMLTAAGFIMLGMVTLVRVNRIEDAWFAYHSALQAVAARYDQEVEVAPERVLFCTFEVNQNPVEIDLDPSPRGLTAVRRRLPGRLVFVAHRKGVAPDGDARSWPILSAGPDWELRAEQPWAARWLLEDGRLAMWLDRAFRFGRMRQVLHTALGAEVVFDLVTPRELVPELISGVELLEFLHQVNG